MAYAGLPPATFSNNLTNVQLVDDISGSFNGSTQTFALTSSSAPFHAVSARSLIVVLGGIVQKPQVDYTVDGANITFTVAPVAGLTFAARNIYGLNYLNNVNDGVITPVKLSTGAPTWNTGGTVTVSGDLNVTGSFNSGTQGLFWGDNEPANFGDGNDLKIYHNSANSYIDDTGTGNLYIRANDLRLQAYVTEENYITANDGGPVALYHNGLNRFETTNLGAVVQSSSPILQLKDTDSTGVAALQRIDAIQSNGTTQWFIGQNSTTDSKLYINNVTSDDILFYTNNTERLRITSTGNIQLNGGILYGDDTALPSFTIQNTSGNSNHAKIIIGEVTASDNGGITFYTAGSSTSTKRLVIKGTSGNVGIGTDNPASKLQVSSTGDQLRIECNAGAGAATYSELSRTLQLACSQENSGSYVVYSDIVANSNQYSENVLRFFTHANGVSAPQERIRITGIGNVGIGTTNPDKKLRVEGDARITGTLTMGTASISINGAHEYPTIRPTLDLNFAATKTLDRRITFTRDSLGTYVDELGIVRYAPNNTPRFDHDPTTGESLGLLIEESRTNILGLSSDLTDNNGNDWDNVNGTIAVNQTTAPDGTNTAASFTTTAGNAEHSVVWAELVPTGDVTASVWVKPNTYSIVSFVLYGEANSIVSYNLNTETVYNQGSNVSRATITKYPNGWYRISATMNCTVSNSRAYRLYASTGNFNADGSESFYYWGPQVETGSFETSYIPTYVSNTSMTRAADIAKITGTNFTDFYNQSEGTTVFEAKTFKNVAGNIYYGEIGDGSGNNRNIMYRNITLGNAIFYYIASGSIQVNALSSGAPNQVNTNVVSAYAYKENDFGVFASGGYSNTDTSGNIMTNVDSFSIGMNNQNNDEHLNGTIKRVSYYNKRLPNAQLQGLTAQ